MSDERPNIIFIITDQQRMDTINALGHDHVDTPNLDRLVSEGVTFTNCHVTAPSCAPSRASLFTGYYPHTTGILKNADRWRHSWIEDLNASGYHCVNVGKMHTWPMTTPLGFHERYVVENKDRYLEGRYFYDEWDKGLRARGLVKQQREQYRLRDDYNDSLGAFTWDLPEETHSDVFVGDMAEWWIRNHPIERPLFMEIGFPGPHPPYDPTPGYAEKYMKREFPLQEVKRSDLDSQPAAYKAMRIHNVEVDHDSVVHKLEPTEAERHKQRAYYMANVEMIDREVGQIMQALEDQGYLENSVVIFTSDHGDCLTDHGHSQKWTMYDTITRVPTIVWSPKRFKGGRKDDTLCQLMDLGPMILELAGLEVPETFEAESLLPACEGEAWGGREYVFAEHAKDLILTDTEFMSMVRSRDWKLVHFIDHEDGQLFNMAEDPEEFVNLWDDPTHADKKREMLDVLREWRIQSQLHTASLFQDHR
ncbi:MAG: sulfatase family protein [Planctomycetota bacterium]|jgi:arylsulfatase A-like enzyme